MVGQKNSSAGRGRFDLLPWEVIDKIAKYFEKDALEFGERSWEKTGKVSEFMDAAFQHMTAYMRGKNDEDHLAKAIYNLLMAADTEKKRTQCQDIPTRPKVDTATFMEKNKTLIRTQGTEAGDFL